MSLRETLQRLLSIAAVFSVSDCSDTHVVVLREGEDVVLSCTNATSPEPCEVDWYFLQESKSTALFLRGQAVAGGQTGAALLENCGLSLHNVRREQAGYYSCTTDQNPDSDSDTILSVITVTEHIKGAAVTLTCSVVTLDFHRPRLTWLNGAEEVPEDHGLFKISRSNSSVSVSFNDTDKTLNHSLSCQTKDDKEQQPDEEEKSADDTWPFRDFLLRHVIMSVGLVCLFVCVGAVHIWAMIRKAKKSSTRVRVRYVNKDDSANIYAVIEDIHSVSTNPPTTRQ